MKTNSDKAQIGREIRDACDPTFPPTIDGILELIRRARSFTDDELEQGLNLCIPMSAAQEAKAERNAMGIY